MRHVLAPLALLLTIGAAEAASLPPFRKPVALPVTRGQCFGDSKCSVTNIFAATGTNAGYSKGVANPLTWAEAYSGGVLQLDQTIAPPGQYNSVQALRVVNGGSGYTSPPTITIANAVGFSAHGVVQNGAIVSVVVDSVGAALSASTTMTGVTITGGGGSGALLTPVVGGTGTFGGAGETLPECLARLPDLVNETWGPKPDFVVFACGRNDLLAIPTVTVSTAAMLDNARKMIEMATNAGILVVWELEVPTAVAQLSGFTTGQQAQFKNQIEAFNQGLRRMAAGDTTLNPNKARFLVVDASKYWYNQTTTSGAGDPAPYRNSDGVHPGQWGGMILGRLLERVLRPYYAAVGGFNTYSPQAYDGTYNPFGTMLPPFNTALDGTTSPCTGAAPHLWSASKVTSTSTLSCSMVITAPTLTAPNSDVSLIPAWTWTFTAGADGNQNEYLQSQFSFPPGASISVGDRLNASCEVAWSGFKNVTRVAVLLTDGTLSASSQQVYNSYYPPSADPFVGAVPASDAVQPFVLQSGALPVTAATISGNVLSVQLQIGWDSSASPASNGGGGFNAGTGAAGTITWRNCQLRKISPTIN